MSEDLLKKKKKGPHQATTSSLHRQQPQPRRLPGLHKIRMEALQRHHHRGGDHPCDETGTVIGSLGRAGSLMSLLADRSPTRLSPMAGGPDPQQSLQLKTSSFTPNFLPSSFDPPVQRDTLSHGNPNAPNSVLSSISRTNSRTQLLSRRPQQKEEGPSEQQGVFHHTALLGELLQQQPHESVTGLTNHLPAPSRGPSPAAVGDAASLSSHSPSRSHQPMPNPTGTTTFQRNNTLFPINVAENLLPLRTYLFDTLSWAKQYTDIRVAREQRLAACDIEEDQNDPELIEEAHQVWRVPRLDTSAEAAQRRREGRFQRPGDVVAHRLQMTASTRHHGGNFLVQIRDYVQQMEQTILMEMEAKKKQDQREEEDEAARSLAETPFALGGVLDKAFGKIAQVGEQKFSSLATRYYYIARRNRQRDVDLRELYVVNLEKRTFRLGAIMSYDEFCVVYRQFHRYANPLTYLVIAQIPRNGWMFVDKLIKALITRKIDKNKTGKIQLPDLVKHLYPAMELEEIAQLIAEYEERYLHFVDKDLHMQIDQIDPDMVDHFGVVFSVVDKMGNGRILRDEFVEGMPRDPQSPEDEESMRSFLAEVFDANCRQDMNEKLELIGESYLDLECLVRALSVQRYNAYGGTMMTH